MNGTDRFDADVIACRRCPRLVAWREQVAAEKRSAFREENYWGKPVPNFGDPSADRLIVGLAPAAHGANRTGRMFTGDRSGEWLYRALHRAGAASRAESLHLGDGLSLQGALITAVCHCAPPDNRPLPVEIAECRPFLLSTLESRTWRAILCLGGLAWQQVHRAMGVRPAKFAHGAETIVAETRLVGSYHPSQQNTFTGRLTEPMLDAVIARWLA
jgi:uracil-DNA glycosylase family 4